PPPARAARAPAAPAGPPPSPVWGLGEPAPGVSPQVDPTFRPSGPTETARVVRVVDGDTIVVRLGGADRRLRYIGMDTPETVKPDNPVEWMGPEASRANARLVEG